MAHSPLEDPSWSELLQRLPAEFDLEATARALGAFQRARGVPDAATLLRLALIYGATNLALRGTAAWARATGVASITDVALLGRLRSASTLLSELVSAILKTTPGTGAVGRRVRLIDATSFAAAGNPLAAWRVHADFDLGQCRFTGFELTDSHEAERLTRFDVEPGDILIGDRIYSQSAAALHQIVTAGGDFLVRRGGSSCRLLTSEGKAFDQKKALARIRYDKTAAFCVLVPVAGGAPMPARLVIHHMPQEHAQEARRRAESRCKVKRGAKDPDNAEFVMLMTTLPEQEFSTDRLLALYRLRWQIEIAFKRLKSLVKLDAIQAKDIRLARTAIYAKLIVALLIEDFLTELLESPPSEPEFDERAMARL